MMGKNLLDSAGFLLYPLFRFIHRSRNNLIHVGNKVERQEI